MAEAGDAGDAGDHADLDALFTWLRSVEIETLDASTLRKAMCATRPLRGWLEVVDARIRTRDRELATQPLGGSSDDTGSTEETASEGAAPPPAGLFPLPTAGALDNSMNTSAGVSTAEGRRREACAHIIGRFAGLDTLLTSGRVTIEHVEAVARVLRNLDPRVSRAVDEHSAEVLNAMQRFDPARLRRVIQRLVTRLSAGLGLERPAGSKPPSTLTHWRCNSTGMGKLQATLTPDDYQRVAAIIEAGTRAAARAAGTDIRNSDRNQLAAQALLALLGATDEGCAAGGGGGGGGGGARLHAHISLIVDQRTLLHGPHAGSTCEYADGTELDWCTLQRLACGADISPIITASGGKVPLAVGREVRHATVHQRRALEAVYATCAMPGCATAVTRCHLHHITYWFAHGRTDLENLLPVCSYHHHRVHEEKWKLTLADDRTLTVVFADGSVETASPDRLTRVTP